MNHYSELQKKFAAMVRENDLNPLLNEIIPGGDLEPAEALLVYQNGFYARMTEAMGETFEGVWRLTGDETFFALCREYISLNKSSTYNISEYGNSFPDFLLQQYPGQPLIAEVAAFEIIFRDLFHAPVISSSPDYSKLTGPEPRIFFHDNVRILSFSGPVYSIWKNRNNDDFSLEGLSLDEPEYILLYKAENNTIYARELDAELFAVTGKLKDGQSITDALAETDETNEMKISELFSFFSKSGIIERIE